MLSTQKSATPPAIPPRGIEPIANSPVKTAVSNLGGAESGARGAPNTEIEAWLLACPAPLTAEQRAAIADALRC